MRKLLVRGRAMFMIVLILSLPIYAAAASAALFNGRVFGADSFTGYVRAGEVFTLEITAQITGDAQIIPTQVSLGQLQGPFFDNCEDLNNGFFKCTKQIDATTVANNKFDLQIRLYKDDNTLDSLTVVTGRIDLLPPKLNSFTLVPQTISTGNVTLQFSLTDNAEDLNDNNKCTGIKTITLTGERGVFKTLDISNPPNICSEQGTVAHPVDLIAASDGVKTVTLTATDSLDNQAAFQTTFNFDTTPPVIVDDSLKITDTSGNLLAFVGSAPVTVNINFSINAEDVDLNKVFADISDINTNAPASFSGKQATCVQTTVDEANCQIAGNELRLDASKSIQIKVNATDTAGNTGTTTISKSIIFDNLGPTIASLRTNFLDPASDRNFAASSTNFTLEFKEVGVGIDEADILLDLSQLSSGKIAEAPDSCTATGNDFICQWLNIPSTQADGVKTVTVLPISQDKLGNKANGPLAYTVILDTQAPIVTSSSKTPLAGGTDATFAPFIKTGDAFILTLAVQEINPLEVKANFSTIITSMPNLEPANCARDGESENLACTFNTNPIDVPNHIITKIPITLTDRSGNARTRLEDIEILNFDNASNIAYWGAAVTCSPTLLDRQVIELKDGLSAYCKIDLSSTGSTDQETLKLELGQDCRDVLEGSLAFIQPPTLANAQPASTDPFLTIPLNKQKVEIDKIELTCPLFITSRVENKITAVPQKVDVPIKLEFYNNPFGQFGSGIEEEIEDAKKLANNFIFKIVGFLKTVIKYADMVCNVLQTLQKLVLIGNVITQKINFAHIAAAGTPIEPILGDFEATACLNEEGLKIVSKKSYAFLGGWCKKLNCQGSPDAEDQKMGEASDNSLASKTKATFKTWKLRGNNLLSKGDAIMPLGGQTLQLATLGLPNVRKPKLGTGNKPYTTGSLTKSGSIEEFSGKQPWQYMNAKDNLGVALFLGCIPGIVNGLEKIRQTFCLKADCLQNNPRRNIPVSECDDLYWSATCKYVVGEIFAILPPTAFLFNKWGLIRQALADPLTAFFSITAVFTKICRPKCSSTPAGAVEWKFNNAWCQLPQALAFLGEIVQDVEGIVDTFDKDKDPIDFCKRLDDES